MNTVKSPEPYRSDALPVANPWDRDYQNAEFSLIYEPLWRMLQAFLAAAPGHAVLDFGCGDGT
jgi:hypothetical protein